MTKSPSTFIKLIVPQDLKTALEKLAYERNITLSALLRLITSEYIRQKGGT